MSPAVGEALEVCALVAHVSCTGAATAVYHGWWLLDLLLSEGVHVAADGHGGAALGSCVGLLRHCLGGGGDAVFGERLEGSLGS